MAISFLCTAEIISREAEDDMEIEKEIKRVLGEDANRQADPAFQNLREFYEKMKKDGIAIKQEYTLPPLDTVGRSLYTQQDDANDKKTQTRINL
jgi:hypothetical protein